MDGKVLWLAECCALRPRMGKSQEVPWKAPPQYSLTAPVSAGYSWWLVASLCAADINSMFVSWLCWFCYCLCSFVLKKCTNFIELVQVRGMVRSNTIHQFC